jgi:hypothetical protein
MDSGIHSAEYASTLLRPCIIPCESPDAGCAFGSSKIRCVDFRAGGSFPQREIEQYLGPVQPATRIHKVGRATPMNESPSIPLFLGIDVAKAKLDCALLVDDGKKRKFIAKTVPNTPEGYTTLADWLRQKGASSAHVEFCECVICNMRWVCVSPVKLVA